MKPKSMEPTLITEPKLAGILEELMKLEPIFHRPESGTSRRDFEAMTEPAFWEVGASGRRYSREFVLDVLEERLNNPSEEIFETTDPYCLEISPDHYLLTYTLIQKDRITRRATIWRRSTDGWKMVYHQGTIVADR
jgi:hypothetical protein